MTEEKQKANIQKTPWKVVEKAVLAFGKLDAVVINHGILSPMTRIENSSVDEWKNLFDANFFSALALVSIYLSKLGRQDYRCAMTDGLTKPPGQGGNSSSTGHQWTHHLHVLWRCRRRVCRLGSLWLF